MKHNQRHAAGWLLAAALVLGGAATGITLLHAADDKPANTLTDDEKAAGWKLLFDGKTGEGWRRYKGDKLPTGWQVADGVLACTHEKGTSGGDIVTTGQYDNFELMLEWKIAPGGNSGLMYRVTEDADAS